MSETRGVTEADLVGCLKAWYGPRSGNFMAQTRVFIPQFRIGTGYGKNNEQRLDAWSMELTDKMVRRAFEVKVSRADLLTELKNPRKRARALLVSNEFYFVTPPGLMTADELPLECGLLEVKDGAIRCVEPAPWRDTPAPTWKFVAAIVRRTEPAPGAPDEEAARAD